MAKNFYETLGVSKTATDQEIKSAYRKLALQYHPDRNKNDKVAEEKFKEINEAYEVLSNPQKKQAYDTYGDAAFGGGAAGGGPFGGGQGGQYGPFTYTYSTGGNGQGFGDFGGGFSDPFEIFEQFFGGASPFGQRKPSYSLQIDFMEAVKGVEKKVTINGKNKTIKIPAGIDDGNRIKFDDFDIIVRVKPDRYFNRQGSDIVTEEEISMTQAALGDVIPVKTVHGEVKLKIPEGTQPNALIRIKDKGMPHVRGNGHGSHYVRVKVKIPTKLSNEQKDLLRQFDSAKKRLVLAQ